MSEQNIRIMCPAMACRKVMTVPNSARGKMVQCPQCRKRIRIPHPAASTVITPIEPDDDILGNKKAG